MVFSAEAGEIGASPTGSVFWHRTTAPHDKDISCRVSACGCARDERATHNRHGAGVQYVRCLVMEIKEIRCPHCNRLLAKGEATHIEIKCPRCGAYTILRASSAKSAGREPLFEVSHAPQAVSPATPQSVSST